MQRGVKELELFKSLSDMLKFQTNSVLPATQTVFRALVDAIIPTSQELEEQQASLQSLGALHVNTADYLSWSLNHNLALILFNMKLKLNLANATAAMLNIAAQQLIETGKYTKPLDVSLLSEHCSFAALESSDRLRVIRLLEQQKVAPSKLPVPFHNNPDFVLAITGVLTLLVISGYYTEWSGYGSTSTQAPEQRVLEHFPTGWKQVGYPGPSLGYHAFRGYLLEQFTK